MQELVAAGNAKRSMEAALEWVHVAPPRLALLRLIQDTLVFEKENYVAHKTWDRIPDMFARTGYSSSL